MREKHSKISILVFAVTTVLLFGFFMLTTSQAFADKEYKGKGKQKEQDKEYRKQERKAFKHKKEQDTHGHCDYKERPDYPKHRGYRERPYGKRRHHRHYDYKGHQYDYHGHWRSWEQWDRYAKKHPHIYKHGRYYRENAHLMFRFCEPGTGSCFFFSIGR
ncbi:MAG: hypothetical protein JRI28_03935 [Deltaproteobacteria bacterium]|nr:hypothetical protein [Deltaproteobacteria bacterium]